MNDLRRLNRFIFVFLGLLAILTFCSFGASFAYIDLYTTAWYMNGLEPDYFYVN